MAGYNQRGMLQAVLAKFTRIDLEGKPIPGPKNMFWSDALISTSFTMAYNRQDDVSITNGAGVICTTYSPPQTLLRLDLADIAFCYPDPDAIEFLAGGVVFQDEDENTVGYAAPPVGRDPKPTGVAMELWSSQIEEGAVVGYFHWLMPRFKAQFTKDQALNGTDTFNTGLEGICLQNSGFGAGPNDEFEDWPLTNRVFQWRQEAVLPEYTYGLAEVAVPTP